MKNKGFTLIELLAVIIIIGLIAVITIPKINDSIESSKQNLAKTNALNYKKTIEEQKLKEQLNKNIIKLNGDYSINSNGNIENNNQELELEISGEKPKNGYLTYIDDELESGCITINKYAVTLVKDEVTNVEKGDCIQLLHEKNLALQKAAISKAKTLATSQTGSTEIVEITEGWVAFINGEVKAYSLKVTEGDYIYVVTDLDVDSNNSHAIADRTISEVASTTQAEQLVVSAKADSYVKAALSANSSLTDEMVKEVSDMSGVITNQPNSGWIHFNVESNTVSVADYSLTYGDIIVDYLSLTNGNYVSTFVNSERNKPAILAGTTQADGAKYLTTVQEVYYNPTTGEKCSSSESVSTTGTTTGCLHWYLYSVKGNYVNMLLDHNITEAEAANGRWAQESDYTDEKSASAGITYPGISSFPDYDTTNGTNNKGPITALNTLKTLTTNWKTNTPMVPNSSSTNEYIIPKSQNDNKYQIDYTEYKARLITKEEAEYLGCTTSLNSCPQWMKKGTEGEDSTTYTNINGYWTSSPRADSSSNAWNVYYYDRSLFCDYVLNTYYGVRPVITVNINDIL